MRALNAATSHLKEHGSWRPFGHAACSLPETLSQAPAEMHAHPWPMETEKLRVNVRSEQPSVRIFVPQQQVTNTLPCVRSTWHHMERPGQARAGGGRDNPPSRQLALGTGELPLMHLFAGAATAKHQGPGSLEHRRLLPPPGPGGGAGPS